MIVNGRIQPPSPEEIAGIRRQNYRNTDELLMNLSENIHYASEPELQRLMVKAFVDIMKEEASHPDMNLNKLTGKAVYLLCWLKRYQVQLFQHGRCRRSVVLFIWQGTWACRKWKHRK